jgi:50S ribosomal subunit-associated GTPase HflX
MIEKMQIEKYAESFSQIYALGNKSDREDKFDQTEVEEFCKEHGVTLAFVSAKTGENVGLVFTQMAERLTTLHPKL